MQTIPAYIVKEDFKYSGPPLADFADVYLILQEVREVQKYPWLSTVDPYGNTVFNKVQIPFVVAELTKLKNEDASNRYLLDIDQVIEACNKVANYEYLLLLGD